MEPNKKHRFKVYGEVTGALTALEHTLGSRNIIEETVWAQNEGEARAEITKKFGAVIISKVERCT